ncbi:AMMECR1 domain-containing protein [Bombardia bombarda]|uniref:AMMECR1 domain-containing protein n=1 Tax=Bombardia bombarda TaxID=252184 RepID=A0AA40C4Q7_9PEZI|nr:AMMECR1 domain-containing protein [Bombardia bombarda]
MATIEHCLYSFEVLAANLESHKPLSLAEVEKYYAEYTQDVANNNNNNNNEDKDDEDKDDDDEAADEPQSTSPSKLAKPLPALRRLAAASSSSSSSSSTPSSTSSTTSLQQAPSSAASGITTPATSTASFSPPLTPAPLADGLSFYALTAALHDTRFSPISLRELPSLEVVVTLLTHFEDAADAMDWELGKHGLRISFSYHGRRYGATYLPDVAPEQGWTKEETVVSLMRKAGWMGRKDKWQEVELRVVRYQGLKESLEYGEYRRWREWVGGRV